MFLTPTQIWLPQNKLNGTIVNLNRISPDLHPYWRSISFEVLHLEQIQPSNLHPRFPLSVATTARFATTSPVFYRRAFLGWVRHFIRLQPGEQWIYGIVLTLFSQLEIESPRAAKPTDHSTTTVLFRHRWNEGPRSRKRLPCWHTHWKNWGRESASE